MLVVRPAETKDIDIIHELDMESVKFHKKFDREFYHISDKWWKVKKDSQIKALKNPTNLILVAEEDKKIIAYIWGIIYKMTKFNVGKIQEIVVTSKHRRRGVAIKLVKRILEFFKSKKCIVSEVEVNVRNEHAMKLYEMMGFVKKNCSMRLKLDKSKSFSPLS